MSRVRADSAESVEVRIHATALVDETAELGVGVEIGPWSIVGPKVRIGDGTRIGSQVLIERNTVVGAGCRIHHGAVLGTDPQDLKFKGEETFLVVGDRTTIREYATLNRGTSYSGETKIGSDCYLMAYSHVAHDCHLGNGVILANAVNMGGHVSIGDWVVVGGLTAIHQFVRIGAHAMVGGASRAAQDVPPYTKAAGSPMKLYGLNTVGLVRRGFSPELRQALRKAYRLVFRTALPLSQAVAMAEAQEEFKAFPEVLHFLAFFRNSKRGITAA